MNLLHSLFHIEPRHEMGVKAWAVHVLFSAISVSLIVNNRFGSNVAIDVRFLMLSGGFNFGFWNIFGGADVAS